MSTMSTSFKSIENKHVVYRGKDCMKKFCEFLREHAMKIIIFKKKIIKLLTKEQLLHLLHFYIKNLKIDMLKMKNIIKLEMIVIIQVNIEVLSIAYVI